MSQKQCPWCGRLGARVSNDADLSAGWAQPHADGSSCVCRHVDSHSRIAALRDGGRYWDGSAWVCPWCGTAPPATEEESAIIAETQAETTSATYTYTIFDADPASSGSCSWPDLEDVEIEGETIEEVIEEVKSVMRAEGASCGEYEPGDRLWATIWDADGFVVDAFSIVIEDDAEVAS